MRVEYTAGYSSAAPSEVATVWRGRTKPSSSKRPLICSMGLNSTPEASLLAPQIGLGAWADAGLVAIHGDFGGISTWGNDTAQARIDDGWAWIKANLPCATDKVLLVGDSMGGLDLLNWAHAHPSAVAGIALCFSVFDLADVHDNNYSPSFYPSGTKAPIETAYGGLAGYQAAEPTHNPNRHPGDFSGIPIFIQYSSNDPICMPSITESFGAACGATMDNEGAVFHGFGNISRSQIYNWLGQYA